MVTLREEKNSKVSGKRKGPRRPIGDRKCKTKANGRDPRKDREKDSARAAKGREGEHRQKRRWKPRVGRSKETRRWKRGRTRKASDRVVRPKAATQPGRQGKGTARKQGLPGKPEDKPGKTEVEEERTDEYEEGSETGEAETGPVGQRGSGDRRGTMRAGVAKDTSEQRDRPHASAKPGQENRGRRKGRGGKRHETRVTTYETDGERKGRYQGT